MMGYVVIKAPKGASAVDLAKKSGEVPAEGEVLASKMVSKVLYLAMRAKPGAPVRGWVVLLRRFPKSGEVEVKAISEAENPCYYDCPPEVLGMLGPSDDMRVLAWRARCAERNYKRASPLRPGDKVELHGKFYRVLGNLGLKGYEVSDNMNRRYRIPLSRRADCNIVS